MHTHASGDDPERDYACDVLAEAVTPFRDGLGAAVASLVEAGLAPPTTMPSLGSGSRDSDAAAPEPAGAPESSSGAISGIGGASTPACDEYLRRRRPELYSVLEALAARFRHELLYGSRTGSAQRPSGSGTTSSLPGHPHALLAGGRLSFADALAFGLMWDDVCTFGRTELRRCPLLGAFFGSFRGAYPAVAQWCASHPPGRGLREAEEAVAAASSHG